MDDNLEAIRQKLADDPTMIRKLKAAAMTEEEAAADIRRMVVARAIPN